MQPKRCRKNKYRDEIAAKLALANIARQDKTYRPKTECRVYFCPICHKWHLTSQERFRNA